MGYAAPALAKLIFSANSRSRFNNSVAVPRAANRSIVVTAQESFLLILTGVTFAGRLTRTVPLVHIFLNGVVIAA